MPRASIHHFALILFVSLGRVAAAADPTRATVASGDTSVQIEAQADKLKLIGCKSLLADWNWTTGSAIPLLNFVVVEGQDLVRWKFKTRKSFKASADAPEAEIFVFENESPALELTSAWMDFSRPGQLSTGSPSETTAMPL
jgi:hypothetical protein